jgi:hypothetical protein
LLLLGDAGLGKKGVGLSREIGRGTSYMTLVRLMMTLVAVFGPQAGARVFATLQRRVGAIWRAIRGRKLTAV